MSRVAAQYRAQQAARDSSRVFRPEGALAAAQVLRLTQDDRIDRKRRCLK